ncbi:MAG: hypothetical protein K2Y37_03585 [Pirellulales bacterium]|nr:hypothetical protein [Pirellulales bacterium]
MPASPGGASSASDPDGGNLLSWPLVVGLMLLVVAILVGALYFDPLDCLVGGAVIALGVAALYVGVWLDDHNGREAIGAPVVLFAAVVFFLVGVMTFVGTFELPGLPADPDAEPEYVPGDLREP